MVLYNTKKSGTTSSNNTGCCGDTGTSSSSPSGNPEVEQMIKEACDKASVDFKKLVDNEVKRMKAVRALLKETEATNRAQKELDKLKQETKKLQDQLKAAKSRCSKRKCSAKNAKRFPKMKRPKKNSKGNCKAKENVDETDFEDDDDDESDSEEDEEVQKESHAKNKGSGDGKAEGNEEKTSETQSHSSPPQFKFRFGKGCGNHKTGDKQQPEVSKESVSSDTVKVSFQFDASNQKIPDEPPSEPVPKINSWIPWSMLIGPHPRLP